MNLQECNPDDVNVNCTFVFEVEEITSDRIFLARCSPVFQKMFFGKLVSDRITITDISAEHFKEMLNYLDNGCLKLQSVLHAWSLFYISHKYVIDSLGVLCADYIAKNLNISNLVLNYEYAEMFNNDKLQTLCMNDIVDYIRGIFNKKDYYHMKHTTLLFILENKILNISNNELIIGVLNWAVIECDIKSISVSTENVISLLKSLNVIYYLNGLDFSISNEDNFLQSCLLLINNLKPSNITPKSYFKRHWCTFCHCRQTYKISSRLEMRGNDVLISNISVNKSSLLFGLVVVTENQQIGNSDNQYKGKIYIEIGDINNTGSICYTEFNSILPYESCFYVPLSNVTFLETDKIYSIKIRYKNLENTEARSKSSILCNYMSNKLIDKRKGLVFTFDELDGSVIRGISYYPA